MILIIVMIFFITILRKGYYYCEFEYCHAEFKYTRFSTIKNTLVIIDAYK